jgi:hypoxanthine phosphoribosyltransferase
MRKVKIVDREFKLFISATEIYRNINRMAREINRDLSDKEVVFIGVLNGSFMFASELYKHIDFMSKITFLKLASYHGTQSTGAVKRLIGINESLENKVIVIMEDIVDTGNTLEDLMHQLAEYNPSSIKVATLLFKKEAYTKTIPIDYIGLEIPNAFIVGFGLDYNGYGRNLEDIYQVVSNGFEN